MSLFFLFFLITAQVFAPKSSHSHNSSISEEESSEAYKDDDLVEILQDLFDGEATTEEELTAMIEYLTKKNLRSLPTRELQFVCDYQLDQAKNPKEIEEIKDFISKTIEKSCQ